MVYQAEARLCQLCDGIVLVKYPTVGKAEFVPIDADCVLMTCFVRRFSVVIHDVATVFARQIDTIASAVRPLVGDQFACGVVPAWHGQSDSRKLARVIDLCGESGEWLVHGMTHQREHRGGIISWLTHRSDEFSGLEFSEIQSRVNDAAALIQELTGKIPVGLVAPCWRLPVDPKQLNGIDYVMGYHRLLPCSGEKQQVSLATWSYDWGRFRQMASAVNLIPAVRFAFTTEVVPCVVIHPADVDRGWLPVAIRRIEWLLEREFSPVTPSQLLTKVADS